MDLYYFLSGFTLKFHRLHSWETFSAMQRKAASTLFKDIIKSISLLITMIFLDWDTKKSVRIQKTGALNGRWSQVQITKPEYFRASFKNSVKQVKKSKQGRTLKFVVLITYLTHIFWSVGWCFNSSTFGRLHSLIWRWTCLRRPQIVWWWEDNTSFFCKIHRTNTSNRCRAVRQNPTNNIFSSSHMPLVPRKNRSGWAES